MSSFFRQLTPITRASKLALFALWWLVATVQAQNAGATDPNAELSPELRALLNELQPKWSYSATAYGGFGYKDNLLLSHANAEGSGLARGGFDLFVLHPARYPDGKIDYSAYVKAEGTHFFSGQAIDHEALASASAKWRCRASDVFRVEADAVGFYMDEVIDVSDTDILRVVVPSKRTRGAVGPTFHWSPRSWWWFEVKGQAVNEHYRDGFNNSGITEGTLQFGWQPTKRFEARLIGTRDRRRFDTREQYSLGGRPLGGTRLCISEREEEARFDITWDKAGHWKTVTRLSKLDYGDNGEGYFNYHQRRLRHDLEWSQGPWLVRLEGSAKRRDFEAITVVGAIGLAPPLRVKEEFTVDARLERKLTDRWKVFCDYTWERSRCNDAIASYRMNEGLLGAVWSWEK